MSTPFIPFLSCRLKRILLTNSKFKFKDEIVVILIIGCYILISAIYHFLSDAPWDDDCVGRYFNTKGAFENPRIFISLWNRPLFTLLFAVPFQISKHAVLIMTLFSSMSAFALFRVSKILKIENAYLIVPFLLFQSFFFPISRSGLAEPLAATIISLGFLFLVRRQFLMFALAGALLPLARLELSLLLIVWAGILVYYKQHKYLLLLGVPSLLWSLAGTYLDGGWMWLYDVTFGKDNDTNRYGNTGFGHYFQRFIYVIGPVVFYFFMFGFLERIKKRKNLVFVIAQFSLGFMVYVVFSWKLSMGQAAGFLRHLITLSPLVAFIALCGFNFWINTIFNHGLNGQEMEFIAEFDKVKFKKLSKNQQKKYQALKLVQSQLVKSKVIVVIFSLSLVVITYFCFSHKILSHHKLIDEVDPSNLIVVSVFMAISLIVLYMSMVKRSTSWLKTGVVGLTVLMIVSFTLINEPPEKNNSPERRSLSRIANVYKDSNLSRFNCYVNHSYFFWSTGIEKKDEKFHTITKENLELAPDSSLIFWENHYSHRLQGDVPKDYIKSKPEYIELIRELSSDKKFLLIVYQKLPKATPDDKIELFDQLLKLFPEHPSVHVNRANVLFTKKLKFEEAIKGYNDALTYDSLYLDAYFNKGMVYLKQKKYELAIENFEVITELKKDSHEAYYNLALTFANSGEDKKSIDHYTKVIELKSDYSQAFFNRGVSYARIGEYEKGKSDFSEAIKLKCKNVEYAYFNRGLIGIKEKNNEEGCEDLQIALKMGHPNAAQAVTAYCK